MNLNTTNYVQSIFNENMNKHERSKVILEHAKNE